MVVGFLGTSLLLPCSLSKYTGTISQAITEAVMTEPLNPERLPCVSYVPPCLQSCQHVNST